MHAEIRYLPLFCTLAFAANPPSARAEHKAYFESPHEVILDLNGNGIKDQARIVPHVNDRMADLFIYLDAGDGQREAARKPSFVRKNLETPNLLLGLEARGNRRLIVSHGCGGCSNDFRTTLSIVYRKGEFWVAGYTYDWDDPRGLGQCDINYFTGKGVVKKGLNGPARPLKGHFRPVKLADWRDEGHRPKACNE